MEDLNVLLESQGRRVMLTREEYEDLLKKAKKAPKTKAPVAAVLVSADYTISVQEQRARLAGTLVLDVLEDGVRAVPLDLSGVGLRKATLDGKAAAIGRLDGGRVTLFVEGKGSHRLLLDMVAPVETTAARRVLNFRVPKGPAGSLKLNVPGDVEIKSGAEVISRLVEKAPAQTRFELLPRAGDVSLAMSLNSRLARRQRAVVSRSVIVDEVTQAYERLHATVSLGILHQAVDSFRFVVPEGFEITDVTSPLLSRWSIQAEPQRRVLEVKLREQTTDTVVLNLSAVRAPAVLDDWALPKLEPLDVVGQVAVVGLLVEERLKAESLSAAGLIPIDTAVLNQALPETIFKAEPGAPPLSAVAAYYAPRGDFSMKARFDKPPAKVAVTTAMLLILGQQRQEVRGGLALLPEAERLFALDFNVPAGWYVTGVTGPGEKRLVFERHGSLDKPSRVHVRLPQGVPVGREYSVNFHAQATPKGWLDDWKSSEVEFPVFEVAGAARDMGVIAVATRDDITVRPTALEKLTPLDEAEKGKSGLAGMATNLAYRYEGRPYRATLTAERPQPRLTARTFSFIRVLPDSLAVRYEIAFQVEEARTRKLNILLPKETPDSLSIVGLDGVALKQFTSKPVDAGRLWTVLLAEPRRGTIRLAVDFQQPLRKTSPLPVGEGPGVRAASDKSLSQQPIRDLPLPIVRAPDQDVAYQSGLVSVEGSAELDVRVKTKARRVDVGELVDADYQPGRRLLGAFGFAGKPAKVTVSVFRHPGYRLDPAIVEKATLTTLLSAEGVSQTEARFNLRTKALYMEVLLPPESELWSADLDGRPIKPQRDGASLLVSLPAAPGQTVRGLKIVYQTPVRRLTMRNGDVKMLAPKLRLRAGRQSDPIDVPLADLQWNVSLPNGYEVTRTGGTVVTDQLAKPEPAAVSVAKVLYMLSGGMSGPPLLSVLNSHRNWNDVKTWEPGADDAPAAGEGYFEYVEGDVPAAKPGEESAVLDESFDMEEMDDPFGDAKSGQHKSKDLASRGSAEKRINDALDSQTELSFIETPLADVVDYLKQRHKIEIQVDNKSLEDVGMGTDSPITRNLKGISLRSALRLMLRDLDLRAIVQDEVLLITTPEEAESRLTTKVYPVSDLVTFRDESGEHWQDFDSLIDTITSTVNPTTWDQVGGPGSVSPISSEKGDFIVLSQTGEIHRQIEALLKQLRTTGQLAGKDGKPPLRARPKPGSGPGGLGGGMGGMAGMGGVGDGMGAGGGLMFSPGEAAPKSDPKRPAEEPAAMEADEEWDKRANLVKEMIPKPADKTKRHVDLSTIPFPDDQPIVYPDKKTWDRLTGVNSLKIALADSLGDNARTITFRSLGVEPRLEITLTNRSWFDSLGWALALAVGLAGLRLTNRPIREKVRLVILVVLVATLVPVVADSSALAEVSNMAFFAACLLIPYYLAAGLAKWIGGGLLRVLRRGRPVKLSAAATGLLLALAPLAGWAEAAKPDAKKVSVPYVIQVVEPDGPVTVPDDAVILPYNPDSPTGIKDASQRLVPYEKYVELWNLAYPDKKIGEVAPPAPFALAGASYTTTLAGDDYLLIEGRLEIDIFTDRHVSIPFGLSGGVLASATLDGKPARLSELKVAVPAKQQPARNQPVKQQPVKPSKNNPFGNASAVDPDDPFAEQPAQKASPQQSVNRPNPQVFKMRSAVVLLASGKGRHVLQTSVRMKLQKRGGWRVAEGILPVAPATGLTITVPAAQTELRLGNVTDRRGYETAAAGEKIETTPGPDGAVSIQWRPKVAEGEVDRSLTAQSNATLDVQEDGLRLTWQLALEFRGSERDIFSVDVPKDYLVEKIEGTNVRGWKIQQRDDRQTVEVSLLKAAKQREAFTVNLWRAATVGQGEWAEFDTPVVSMPDAALHTGRLTVRRSPLLDLRVTSKSGVSRTDLSTPPPGAAAASVTRGGSTVDESPLGIRPFQAYRFGEVPFAVRLAAAAVPSKTTAEVQTVLRIAEYERSLESRVNLSVEGRPVYRVEMFLPDAFTLDEVSAPGRFQWAVTERDERRLLTVYLAAGQPKDFAVVIRGKLAREKTGEGIPLPQMEVLGVGRQQGQIAVQVDPAFDVKATDLTNGQNVLLRRLHGWLQAGQRGTTRLALEYRRPDYSGTLRLTLRKPDVSCWTISNVRVTDRAVEETILLNFTVRHAGIRELSFLLPREMDGCRISVPMLREKTITPVGQAADAPRRVRIQLQDEIMDELRVLIEHDRLLERARSYHAPIPVVETGRTDRRFVTLESAGRDEVAVERSPGLEELGRQQKQWQVLKGMLGAGITQAYLVTPGAKQSELVYTTKDRKAVRTAGARIGLAETNLVVDANGAYRGQVVYRLDNSTEQFLQLALPQGSRLWTARVAGEPVKPIKDPDAADERHVRIPLVKTAPGDLDYQVVLKYGGKMPKPGLRRQAEFPLMHTLNINVELSQVRLHLPEDYRWYFDGTMRQVKEEGDLAAGYVAYQTKLAEGLVRTMRHGGEFSKVRAMSNLKNLQDSLESFQSTTSDYSGNEQLQRELTNNAEVLRSAEQEAQQIERAPQQAVQGDNRYRLNDLYAGQKSSRARNVVQDLGYNWSGTRGTLEDSDREPTDGNSFNSGWFDQNKLKRAQITIQADSSKPRRGQKGRLSGKGEGKGGQRLRMEAVPANQQQPQAQPQAPAVAQGKAKAKLQKSFSYSGQTGNMSRQQQSDAVARYQKRLEDAQQPSTGRGQVAGEGQSGVQPRAGRRGMTEMYGRPVDPRLPPPAPSTPSRERDRSMDLASRGPRRALEDSQELPPGRPGVGLQEPSAFSADLDVPTIQAGTQAAVPPEGLASLDVQLPQRGHVYLFTTPRGEVKITGRAASNDLIEGLEQLAALAVLLLVAACLLGLGRRGLFAWFGGPSGSTVLISAGCLMFFFGVLPIAGLIAFVTGIVIKCRRWSAQSRRRRRAARLAV